MQALCALTTCSTAIEGSASPTDDLKDVPGSGHPVIREDCVLDAEIIWERKGKMKTAVWLCLFALFTVSPLLANGQDQFVNNHVLLEEPVPRTHRFADKTNLRLQTINILSQTGALLAIHSHDYGRGMARCAAIPCMGALEARGRTLDPLEKHFESYGYGWGAVYRYGGGVALNAALAYMFHATGHHKLERWVPLVGVAHAGASIGYALTGSRQGR